MIQFYWFFSDFTGTMPEEGIARIEKLVMSGTS
jgi:hypothetical protein